VRLDDHVSSDELRYLLGLRAMASLAIEFSGAAPIDGLAEMRVESVEDFSSRVARFDKVRWLSNEPVPSVAALEQGVSVDARELAQSGAVELPRWLLEQSVSITNHRYGNAHAGPKPAALGLGEAEARPSR
jgi:RHH-type proline utilization regulon transcriptional repressor/proline dehydrogenase/delta 1-pyrroline-5-carboxylate dehydrogenase